MKTDHLHWWSNLRHGGLLLDLQRLSDLVPSMPPALPEWKQDRLRREVIAFQDSPDEKRGKFVALVLEDICGFSGELGAWYRGSNVSTAWTRRGLTGESLRPNHLWLGQHDAVLPVFLDTEKRIGIGRGKRITSRALQWLRQGNEQLAIITNGYQWRIVFAGLDYEAWSEWELDQWLAEGRLSDEFDAFRALVSPAVWTPPEKGQACPLLAGINNSRKGQSDLSKVLGERVRQAAELLIDGHAPALNPYHGQLDPQDIYRAAVRVIMRMVVILFAESREGLLPRDNPVFHTAYSLQGLRELLDRSGASRLVTSYSAWPRILALFRLIFNGSSHEAMPVPKYGGELFAPGRKDEPDGMKRALYLFENACFTQDIVNDALVRQLLELLTRTKIAIRQGRSSSWTMAPVDFASLDSEYIGILYEGLLDFELRCGVDGQPIVFLAVGNQPALPLATLEAMDDRAVRNLFEKLKDTSSKGDEEGEDEDGAEADADTEEAEPEEQEEEPAEDTDGVSEEVAVESDDPRFTLRARAEQWAQRAVVIAGLMKKPKGKLSPEKQIEYDRTIGAKARQLVTKVVLPGEWYLVRWGGTRKGSGTFYTRPQLAIPTVHRTLRPLAYNPPKGEDGKPNLDAPARSWTPKKPIEILSLRVCDPACGSGSFPLAALRYLTEALLCSVKFHGELEGKKWRRPLYEILGLPKPPQGETLRTDYVPCAPDDADFDNRAAKLFRRYIVERCIYGVDLDPLAVELSRLSLWIETLDRNLPITFLNHKIKCGNSLVGAWFDQFLHYPAMAWDREGGDKNHSNGVHFKKDAWTKAISKKMNAVKAELKDFIDGGTLFYPVNLETVRTEHDAAAQTLRQIHALPAHDAALRAEKYQELLDDDDFKRLKEAFDLWCALWFWPPDQLDHAPMPVAFASNKLSDEARRIARRVAAERRFFHWELEFPDVFSESPSSPTTNHQSPITSHQSPAAGFDAILGNPPWETLQPVSKEFFSAIDPMYRSYGKQEALAKQNELFEANREAEVSWLGYNAFFKAMANWLTYAGRPFGDRVTKDSNDREKHDLNLGDRGRSSFETSAHRHAHWKQKREETIGYADAEHVFQHQGTGKAYTYKMFLEQAHALLRPGGRLGLIVPSGLYSDHGTRELRRLFLDQCRWEWLFGFENREKIFDIDSRFKFNPVIIQKGVVGDRCMVDDEEPCSAATDHRPPATNHQPPTTNHLKVAFMRRNLADWEHAEDFAVEYPRERVVQFSPNSLAILEIQSARDLEVLTKIYANSVLLGDQGSDGWGIKYAQGDFNMTSDSKLFPPRTKWEEWGYRPDEYSRWIKGPWRPIAELWAELGVDPERPTPIAPECARQIADGIARGEVAQTGCQVRCAQPPYDRLPIPRADIPEGIILSREATHYLHEDEIPIVTFTEANGKPLKIKVENDGGDKEEMEVRGRALALPLYQGVMIWQLNSCASDYLRGATHSARWERRSQYCSTLPEPQFVMAQGAAECSNLDSTRVRIGFRAIQNATNQRTMICSLLPGSPAGHSLGVFYAQTSIALTLPAFTCDFAYDFALRPRMSQANLSWFILEETPVPRFGQISNAWPLVYRLTHSLTMLNPTFAVPWLQLSRRHSRQQWKSLWAVTDFERMRLRCICDAVSLGMRGLQTVDLERMIKDCDHPVELMQNKKFTGNLYVKDFWRVDKDKHPEHRHTVLTLVAFHDLQEKIAACGGDVDAGIEAFCTQNDGEGWMLPETLRLADYGLGHDDRAKEHQPVRECFGPRFYDWQLAQSPEESWRECHLHARNLLGKEGYQALLDELEGKPPAGRSPAQSKKSDAQPGRTSSASVGHSGRQLYMDQIDGLPLFERRDEKQR